MCLDVMQLSQQLCDTLFCVCMCIFGVRVCLYNRMPVAPFITQTCIFIHIQHSSFSSRMKRWKPLTFRSHNEFIGFIFEMYAENILFKFMISLEEKCNEKKWNEKKIRISPKNILFDERKSICVYLWKIS